MSATDRDAALLRFRMELVDQLDQVRHSDKAVKTILRLTRALLSADEGCVATTTAGGGCESHYLLPHRSRWDPACLAELQAARRPKLPPDLASSPLTRRDRVWGHLVLRRSERPFTLDDRRLLNSAAAFASRLLERLDRLRAADVRARIDRKILEQLRPKDLFYQILHGLRQLTRYDHSAAMLVFDAGSSSLRVAAEQIAWRKGKSERVGAHLPVDDDVLGVLEGGVVHALQRSSEGGLWETRRGRGGHLLATRLNGGRTGSLDEPQCPARSLLVAPLVARDRLLAVLEIASCQAGSLGPWEVDLVRGLLPQAAVAVANLDRTESLEQGMLQAERKHVMAELARGVSHDVNNALGAVLPLVQQMAADLREQRADPDTLLADLAQVESSVQICRRIFGGMLAFGHGARGHPSQSDVLRAVRSALGVLEEGLRRQEVELRLELPEVLPRVRGSRGDLEQVVLNLAGNARDAMPDGGVLTVTARLDGTQVVLSIRDTGRGIAAGDLARVSEPFFTTKRHGNGLGLSICRSIVWTMGGSLAIESAPGEGTTVIVHLPVAEPETEPVT